MEINLYLLICLLFFALFVLPFSLAIFLKNKKCLLKILMILLFAVYLAVIFVGTTAVIVVKPTSMLIYYDFSNGWFSMSFLWFGSTKINFFINLIMMFPIGFFVYAFFEKCLVFKTILFSFILSLLIEMYQFVLPVARNTEILDLILNTASGSISALYMFIMRKFKVI